MNKILIGKKEKVSFPDLGRHHIVARIDTGAKSSAVHCDTIWLEEMGGKRVLCCHFLKRSRKVVRFKKFKTLLIKSSNGDTQKRYAVKLRIALGHVIKETLVTLTDRSTMNYTVLLGRRFLRPDFVVDVDHSYLVPEINAPKASQRKAPRLTA